MTWVNDPRSTDFNRCFVVRDSTGKEHSVRQQHSDIDTHVEFSYLRCILSTICILLVLTDIPRTGVAVNLFAYYPKVAPGTAMYYGPYAYPVIHLNRSSSTIGASAGDQAIDRIELWPYKYDSVSIPIRALAKALDVSSFPRCLFYEEKLCSGAPTMPARTVFMMLDDLMTAIHHRYFSPSFPSNPPVVFETVSVWADRLHHVIIGSLGHRIDPRVSSVHAFTVNKTLTDGQEMGINVCRPLGVDKMMLPLSCIHAIEWLTDHPTLGPDVQISLSESVNLRFSSLQKQYPNAILDLTLITSRLLFNSQRNSVLPSITFLSDNIEVTTFIRGRHCNKIGECTTIFIDDYRYERASVETSSEEFKAITGIMRGISQGYVWLRVALLVYICAKARLAERAPQSQHFFGKVRVVCWTVAKIPSHVVVYGSWVPLIGYSLAHFIDCGLVHLISDNFWSTHNGVFIFDVVSYVVIASIQMRNTWVIGLGWKCVAMVYGALMQHRCKPWVPRDGVIAFRGVFIGMTSFLTIFSFLRALRFRDSRVISFREIPGYLGMHTMVFVPLQTSTGDFGYRLDVKTTAIATGLVGVMSIIIQTILRKYFSSKTRFLTCRTYYVPLAVGKLYSASSLNVFWYMHLIPSANGSIITRPSSFLRKLSSTVLAAIVPLSLAARGSPCEVCNFVSTQLQWRVVQGCRSHETLFSLGRRSVETQSMVRLINIAMMSDPIVFLRLRLFGKPLYLYRVCSLSSGRQGTFDQSRLGGPPVHALHDAADNSLVLSPRRLNKHEPCRAVSEYVLVGIVNTSSVPWGLLVDCG